MGIHKDSLVAKLWEAYNAGKMPTGIKVSYQTFNAMVSEDADLLEDLEYRGDTPPFFQGLPLTFDSWYPKPVIITVERNDDGQQGTPG